MPFVAIAFVAVFSVALMLLWNWLMPVIFGLTTISFWQAVGLLLLSRILVGGFGFGRPGFHSGMMGPGCRRGMANPIRERWMSMSEEERKEFLKNHRRTFSGGLEGAMDEQEQEER